MAYSYTSVNRKGFLFRFKMKFGKWLIKCAPHIKIRVLGVKICGYKIGSKVYLGPDLIIASMNSEKSCFLQIGNRVAIGPRVTIVLSSDANWSRLANVFKPIRSKVVLQDDCWVGAGTIILPGITIGECSIVGAGSIVTKDVDPFTVVVGSPAKVIREIKKF